MSVSYLKKLSVSVFILYIICFVEYVFTTVGSLVHHLAEHSSLTA